MSVLTDLGRQTVDQQVEIQCQVVIGAVEKKPTQERRKGEREAGQPSRFRIKKTLLTFKEKPQPWEN